MNQGRVAYLDLVIETLRQHEKKLSTLLYVFEKLLDELAEQLGHEKKDLETMLKYYEAIK